MGKFVSQRMKFALCYHDKLGRPVALACAVTVELAKAIARAMANDLELGQYYAPNQRPIVWVYDEEGRNYGTF